MVGRILLGDVVLVAQLDVEIAVVAPLHHPAVRVRVLERLGGRQLDLIVRVLLVVGVDHHVARVLRSDWHDLAAELRERRHILDLIRRVLADRQTDDARADVVLRENIFLLARIRDPNALRPNRILARFDADEQVVVRGRHEFELILRQFLRDFLHHCDLEPVGFALLVHIVVRHIVVRVRDRDDLLAVRGFRRAAVHRVLAAARKTHGKRRTEERRQRRFRDFIKMHFAILLYQTRAASRTHAKRFRSMSRGTVQSAPSRTPVRPAVAKMRRVSASTSARLPR